jgi:hypothetical protein
MRSDNLNVQAGQMSDLERVDLGENPPDTWVAVTAI